MTRQSANKCQRYRFGEFLFDPAARQLQCGGDVLTTSPKVFDCIAYLIEHRERAVGHDELTAAVWGRANITDGALRQLMRKVRRVVHDDGDRQVVVRTIPHFGFHWIAVIQRDDVRDSNSPAIAFAPPVDRGPIALASESSLHRVELSSSLQVRLRSAVWASVILCMTLGLLAADQAQHRGSTQASATMDGMRGAEPARRRLIGVLPVDVDTEGDPDSAWIRLGLMDIVATRLRKSSLVVVPSSDIAALDRDRRTDATLAKQVRSATGARDLVVPSVIRSRDGWTVRLDLQSSTGSLRTVEVQSQDAIIAAREATDRLLALVGKPPLGGIQVTFRLPRCNCDNG